MGKYKLGNIVEADLRDYHDGTGGIYDTVRGVWMDSYVSGLDGKGPIMHWIAFNTKDGEPDVTTAEDSDVRHWEQRNRKG